MIESPAVYHGEFADVLHNNTHDLTVFPVLEVNDRLPDAVSIHIDKGVPGDRDVEAQLLAGLLAIFLQCTVEVFLGEERSLILNHFQKDAFFLLPDALDVLREGIPGHAHPDVGFPNPIVFRLGDLRPHQAGRAAGFAPIEFPVGALHDGLRHRKLLVLHPVIFVQLDALQIAAVLFQKVPLAQVKSHGGVVLRIAAAAIHALRLPVGLHHDLVKEAVARAPDEHFLPAVAVQVHIFGAEISDAALRAGRAGKPAGIICRICRPFGGIHRRLVRGGGFRLSGFCRRFHRSAFRGSRTRFLRRGLRHLLSAAGGKKQQHHRQHET